MVQKIIIHNNIPVRLRIKCPECGMKIFTPINDVLHAKKFVCYKCKKHSDLKKIYVEYDIRRYLDLCFKHFSTRDKEGKLEDEIEVMANMNNKYDFDAFFDLINNPHIAWDVGEPKETSINIKTCLSCGICNDCEKQVKLNKDDGMSVCSECGSRNIRFTKVEGVKCPNCSNKKLKVKKTKIVKSLISIKELRNFYKKSELRLEDG